MEQKQRFQVQTAMNVGRGWGKWHTVVERDTFADASESFAAICEGGLVRRVRVRYGKDTLAQFTPKTKGSHAAKVETPQR